MKGNLRRLLAIFLVLMLLSADICAIAEAVATLTLPSALQIIEEEAFYGNTSIEKVIVPDGTTEIRSKAFADSSLTELELPDTLTFIAEDTFDGCSEFTLTVPENCYAYDRCVELGLIEAPNAYAVRVACDVTEAYVTDTATWTAEAVNGLEPYKYYFTLYKDGVKLATRAYNAVNTYSYTFTEAGEYYVIVKAKDDNGDITNEIQSETLTVGLEKLMVTAVTCDKESLQTTDTAVWTAAATGGQAPYAFAFDLRKDGASVASQEASDSAEFSFTFVDEGDYTLCVTVTDGLGAQSEVYELPVTVALRPIEITSLTASVTGSQTEEAITWTVEVIGGKAPYSYAFDIALDGVSLGKSESQTENTYIYTPETVGAYTVIAEVTDAYGNVATLESEQIAVTLMPLTINTISVNSDWVKVGEEIVWTVDAMGGVKPLRYAFDVFLGGEEMDGRAFVENENTYAYTPDTAGVYSVNARVRDSQNTTVELVGGEVNVYDVISITSVTPESDTVVAGNIASWTVSTNGGKGTLTYDYKVYYGEELAYTAQNHASNIIEYVPMHSGSYIVEVVAKDENGETAEATGTAITVTAAEATPAEYFTVVQTSGNFGQITAYTGTDTAVVIPGEIGEYTIESIGSNAFKNNTNIISVSMPASLKNIGSYAFYGCTNLQGVSLNDGLEIIYREAFAYCYKLTELYIPDSVTTLSYRAFYGCSKLSEMNYPMGWVTTYAYDNSVVSWADHYGGIFAGTALKTWHIPEGATVPAYAFKDCSNFSSITINETGVGRTGGYNFMNCTGLTAMVLPDNWKNPPTSMFEGCTGLVSVQLGGETETLGSYVFKGCTKLESINLPETLTIIYREAFMNCTSLTELYIPDSVTTLSYRAFYGCSKLSEMNYPMGWVTTYAYDNSVVSWADHYGGIFSGTALKTLKIPDGATIPAYAFKNCTNFTHFELPDSLQSIPAYAFAGCTGLEKIWIPEGIELQYDEEGNQTDFVPIASTAFNDISTSTMSIHGVSGSYAETFAAEKGYPFVAEAFEYTPATLSGTVTDAAGSPLSGVTVTVYKGPTTNYPFGSTTTDSTGAWSVSDVKVGSYYGVGFEKEGYIFNPSLVAITIMDGTNQLNDVVGYTAETTAYLNLSDYEWISASDASLRVIQIDSSEDWSIAECSEWIDMYVADVGEDVSEVDVQSVQTYALVRTSTQETKQLYKRGTPLMLLLGYNDSAETREGSIAIESAGLRKTISIYQQAFDNAFGPQINIVNPTGDGETVYRVGDALHIVLSGRNFGIGEVVILDGAGTSVRYPFTENETEIVHTLSATGMCTITAGVVSEDDFESNGYDYDAAQTVSIVVDGSSDSIGGMKVSDQFIAYVEEREGRHYTMYKDSANKDTIGIGHLISDDELEAETFKDRTLTDEEVEALFRSDITEAENIVNQYATDKGFSFSQNQFDALVSFSFNLGDRFYSKNKDGSKTKLNEWLGSAGPNIEDWKVFNAFARWHHSEVNGVMLDTAGLYYRRMEEATMFTQGIYDVRYNWPLPDWFKDKAVGADVPDDWYSSGIATLSTGATQVSVGVTGGTRSVSVFASDNWTATTADGWITLTTSSGSGNGTLKFNVDAHTEQLARTGHIQITMGDLSCTVEVTQTGTAGETLLVYATTDSISVRPGDNVRITASASGGSGNYNYTLLVYKNSTIIYESPAQASNILEYIPLLDGDYNYKVRVKDGTSKSTISALGVFKAVCDPITGLTSLVDGAVYGADGLKKMNIDWDPAIGATSYQIRVRNLKTGEMFISDENSDKGYEVADSSVKFDQYTWSEASWFRLWIGAFDENGAKVAQTQRVFSTYDLPEVVINSPTSTEITTAEDVSISWNEVDKAAWYLLSVRNTNTNESLRNSKKIDKAVRSDVLSASSLIAGNAYNIWIAAYSEDGARIAEKIFKFTYSPEGTEVGTPVAGTTIKIRGVDLLYAPGEYFTQNGEECGCHGNSTCGEVSTCNCIYYFKHSRGYSDGDSNVRLGDGQCKGFALYSQVMLYGSKEPWTDSTVISANTSKDGFYNYGSWSAGTSSANIEKLKALITKAGVGAHIRTSGSAHSMVVVSINNQGFTIAQANGGNNNEYSSYSECRIGTSTYTWESYAQSSYGKRGIKWISNYVGENPPSGSSSTGSTYVTNDYSTPLVGYALSNNDISTYSCMLVSAVSGSIDGSADQCTISYVYNNGFALVTYPTTNGNKTRFVKLSAFIDTSFSKYAATMNASSTTYRKPDLSAAFGNINSGTSVTVVGKSSSSTQIIYASGDKYYLAWVPSSAIQ